MTLEIFILTYNRKKSLKLSLESILNQTYQDFKLIVLDNASNYDVHEITDLYKEKKIEVIKNKYNIGPVENYAKAINLASKDLVMIFHDDDTMPMNFIENQVYLLKKFSNIGFVVTGINLTKSLSNIDTKKSSSLEYILFEEKGEMLKCFYDFPTFGASSIMFRTIIAKNGIKGYKKFGNVVDRMMLLNCSRDSSFAYMINPKYNALQHESQDSSYRNWDFKYDINLSNLYLKTINDFHFDKYIFKVVKSISEFYVYSKKRYPLIKTLNKIYFKNNFLKIYFILLIPILLVKSKIIQFIKKHFINLFIKLNHFKYQKKLSLSKIKINSN